MRIIIGNATGNNIIFVLDKVDKEKYKYVAKKLLEKYKNCYKVAFVTGEASFDMMEFEFSGNAARIFGLIKSKLENLSGIQHFSIELNSCQSILKVETNFETGDSQLILPAPNSITELEDGELVDWNGFTHFVIWEVRPTPENFEKYRAIIRNNYDYKEIGVMFCNYMGKRMIPAIHSDSINNACFQGSSTSGTAAVACTLAILEANGNQTFNITQPKGMLSSTVAKVNDKITSVSVKGKVEISDIILFEEL